MTSRRFLVTAATIAAMFLSGYEASANFVIDKFTPPAIGYPGPGTLGPTLVTHDVTSSRTIVRTADITPPTIETFVSGSVGGSGTTTTFTYVDFSPPFEPFPTVTYNYDFLSPVNFSAGTSLIVPFLNTLATAPMQVDVSLFAGPGPAGLIGTLTQFPSAPANLLFATYTLGPGAASVDYLRITLTQLGLGAAVVSGSHVTNGNWLQTVPEPATMALLGVSSLGGLGLKWLRRRKSAEKVA